MWCKRTANAGVLLELDGIRILLDGVCGKIEPYLETPEGEKLALLQNPPSCVAFTHGHTDHCDASFIPAYLEKTAGSIMGPADIPYCEAGERVIGNVKITPVESRHIGKSDGSLHQSYVIEGSQCLWFTGDASPLQLRKWSHLPRPQVLIAPYAYATGNAWQICKELGVETVVLLHLPQKGNDPYGLWEAVKQTVGEDTCPKLLIPEMGEKIFL